MVLIAVCHCRGLAETGIRTVLSLWSVHFICIVCCEHVKEYMIKQPCAAPKLVKLIP